MIASDQPKRPGLEPLLCVEAMLDCAGALEPAATPAAAPAGPGGCRPGCAAAARATRSLPSTLPPGDGRRCAAAARRRRSAAAEHLATLAAGSAQRTHDDGTADGNGKKPDGNGKKPDGNGRKPVVSPAERRVAARQSDRRPAASLASRGAAGEADHAAQSARRRGTRIVPDQLRRRADGLSDRGGRVGCRPGSRSGHRQHQEGPIVRRVAGILRRDAVGRPYPGRLPHAAARAEVSPGRAGQGRGRGGGARRAWRRPSRRSWSPNRSRLPWPWQSRRSRSSSPPRRPRNSNRS